MEAKNNKIYKEAQLSQDFCSASIEEVLSLISKTQSFNLVSMPGVGVTVFFKYLISTQKGSLHFIYIDAEHQNSPTKEEFYKQILEGLGGESEDLKETNFIKLCEEQIKRLSETSEKIIFIFNHFHLLKGGFDEELFTTLRNLRSLNTSKLCFIFYSDKPLYEIMPERLLKFSLTLISKIVYFPTYPKKDLKEIAQTILLADEDEALEKAIKLSGGHYLLLQLLLRSERPENPLLDPFIRFNFGQLTQFLSYKQRKTLEKIASLEEVNEVDPYLLNTGIVKDDKTLYSPLFGEYLKNHLPLKFSSGEARLFKLLKKNLGKIVSKDEIFSFVWREDEFPSDWALNSMIYRIRNNPAFKEQGYSLVSFKKQGYSLIKD